MSSFNNRLFCENVIDAIVTTRINNVDKRSITNNIGNRIFRNRKSNCSSITF